MKLPKTLIKYCKYCKKRTEQVLSLSKIRDRSALKKGSIKRAKKRGLGRGKGNLGKYGSKGSMSSWKRYGVKTSKKQDLRVRCKICGKSSTKSISKIKKLEIK